MDAVCRRIRWLALGLGLLGLAACQGPSSDALTLTGQVGGVGGSHAKVSHYAASRFLDQASMGPSPESVAQVRGLGLQGWIDAQMKMAPSQIVTPASIYDYDSNDRVGQNRATNFHDSKLHGLLVGGQDQLRLRTTWALSNFLVVSLRKIQPYGASEYFNVLQRNAFGNYADLLKGITLSPAMGFYLDNSQNTRHQLNENYGRELMQLFSVRLVNLNPDGTVRRGASGKPVETYSQRDVIEATRALTGWSWAEGDQKRASANFANYGKTMVQFWQDQHDTGSKTVLGKTIPAGQSAEKDLDSLIQILVQHPNTAPFVSLRLIQGLTTSNPSSAYLGRVAKVFADTGGQLGKVITAILMDPEARQADDPSQGAKGFGRIQDPLQLHISVLRGLSCQGGVLERNQPENYWKPWSHNMFMAPSVFNFFPPNHRSPNSQLLAPEQKTLTASEFNRRMGNYHYNMGDENTLLAAGCQLNAFKDAAAQGDAALVALIGERYFRGQMPATIAKELTDGTRDFWDRNKPMALTGAMLEMALISSSFGAST